MSGWALHGLRKGSSHPGCVRSTENSQNVLSLGITLKVLISSVWHSFLSLESSMGQSGLRINLQRTGSLWAEGKQRRPWNPADPATGRRTHRGNPGMRHEERVHNASGWRGQQKCSKYPLPAVLVLTSLMFQQQWVRVEIIWTLESSLNSGCDNH